MDKPLIPGFDVGENGWDPGIIIFNAHAVYFCCEGIEASRCKDKVLQHWGLFVVLLLFVLVAAGAIFKWGNVEGHGPWRWNDRDHDLGMASPLRHN